MDDHPVADGSTKAKTAHHAQSHEKKRTYNLSVNCSAGPSLWSRPGMLWYYIVLLSQSEHVCSDRNNKLLRWSNTGLTQNWNEHYAHCLHDRQRNCGSIAVKREPARKSNIVFRTHMFQIRLKILHFLSHPTSWIDGRWRDVKKTLQLSLRNTSRREKILTTHCPQAHAMIIVRSSSRAHIVRHLLCSAQITSLCFKIHVRDTTRNIDICVPDIESCVSETPFKLLEIE